MPAVSPALRAALADVERTFAGRVYPHDDLCGMCYGDEGVPELAVPDLELPTEALNRLSMESIDHLSDYPAMVRRILPQLARGMADGSHLIMPPPVNCLASARVYEWLADEARVVQRFVATLLDEARQDPASPWVRDLFEIYAEVVQDAVGPLDAWPVDPVSDQHFVRVARPWLHDLLYEDPPVRLGLWADGEQESLLASLQAWFMGPGAERLRRCGATDYADAADLLALPCVERLEVYQGQVSS